MVVSQAAKKISVVHYGLYVVKGLLTCDQASGGALCMNILSDSNG